MRSPLAKNHRITSGFGMRTLGGATSMHNGIDMVPADGTANADIYAVCEGTVIDVLNSLPDSHTGLNVKTNASGNYVKYKTQSGYTIIYYHLKANSVCVEKGQAVKAGGKIGVMGTTGRSTGVHLHYEIRDPKNNAIDPKPYLDSDKPLPCAEDKQDITASTPQVAPQPTANIKTGDIVQFTGGSVYVSSDAVRAAATRPASRCKATRTYNGKHPYHLISEDGNGVYGWVDANCVTNLREE